MAGSPQKTALGITRQQGILIGTLGSALIGVLLMGQGSNETNGVTTGSTPPARRRAAPVDALVATTKWPEVSLDQMLQHNPFAAPTEPATTYVNTVAANNVVPNGDVSHEPDDEAEQLEEERRRKVGAVLADLKSQKVTMILRTGEKVSAVIGERLLHEGDVIDGVRVISILPNGVVVEPDKLD